MNAQEWTREAQNFTLATATRINEEWLHSDIKLLETLKNQKLPIRDIASALHRSYFAVSSKLIELGLANAHRKSNTPKIEVTVCAVCFTTPSKTGVCLC